MTIKELTKQSKRELIDEFFFQRAKVQYLEECLGGLFSRVRLYAKKAMPEDIYTGYKAWIAEINNGKYDDGDYEQIDKIKKVLEKEAK